MFESDSAGTETKERINQDAVRLMKKHYGVDMEAEDQYSKRNECIPEPDVVISMGCNVACPYIGKPFDERKNLIPQQWDRRIRRRVSDLFCCQTFREGCGIVLCLKGGRYK